MASKEADMVLRLYRRGPFAPSLTPFTVKLETYLRMSKIPYKNVFGTKMSPKGKTPWIEFKGKAISDSQFIIDFLNKEYEKDSMQHLSAIERATARAYLKMVEENLYWALILWRWRYDDRKFLNEVCKFPILFLWYIARKVCQQAYGQGMGRHSKEEVMEIAKGDLEALSTYLGEKPFFMGEEPCDVDCAIFGMLAQIKWNAPGSPLLQMMNDLPNLHDYCDHMKTTFWPDWDECNTNGGTKEATK